jgi:glycosyltransferase involved in cell wall biosynthesis
MEGLSLALLDAMGAGVCALTSDIAENRELVDHGGFTFRRNDVNDLERMLRLLLSEDRVRKDAALKGQEYVRQNYLWETITEQIEKVYLDLAGQLVNHRSGQSSTSTPDQQPQDHAA